MKPDILESIMKLLSSEKNIMPAAEIATLDPLTEHEARIAEINEPIMAFNGKLAGLKERRPGLERRSRWQLSSWMSLRSGRWSCRFGGWKHIGLDPLGGQLQLVFH